MLRPFTRLELEMEPEKFRFLFIIEKEANFLASFFLRNYFIHAIILFTISEVAFGRANLRIF